MPVFYTLIGVFVGVGLLALLGMYTSSLPVSFDRYRLRRSYNEIQPYAQFVPIASAASVLPESMGQAEELPPKRLRQFQRKSPLLNQEESQLFEALRVVCGRHYVVLIKVALPELVGLRSGVDGLHASEAYAKIAGQHAGFVVVVAATWEPVCVVELDYPPPPGERPSGRFGDTVLESSGIPVFGVPQRPSYDLGVLRVGLHAAISRGVGLRQFLRNA